MNDPYELYKKYSHYSNPPTYYQLISEFQHLQDTMQKILKIVESLEKMIKEMRGL
jgi:hypothetical protein